MEARLAGTIASSVTAHMYKGKQDLLSFNPYCILTLYPTLPLASKLKLLKTQPTLSCPLHKWRKAAT